MYALGGDLNGDGADDLAASYYVSGYSFGDNEYASGTYHGRVLYGGGDLTALPLDDAFEFDANYVRCLMVADFDGDGLDDLATGCTNTTRLGIYALRIEIRYGSPAGIAAAPDSELAPATRGTGASAGDVDGDGRADILVDDVQVETTTSDGGSVWVGTEGGALYRGADGLAAPAIAFGVRTAPDWPEPGDRVKWGPLVDVDLDGYADILARDLQHPSSAYGSSVAIDVLWGQPIP